MAETKLTTCSVETCERPAHSRGYCGMHYKRVAAHGTPHAPCKTCGAEIDGKGPKNYCSESCRPTCSVDGCGRKLHTSSLCHTHYKHRRAGKPILEIQRYATQGCAVRGCNREHVANGFCGAHYARFLAAGTPERLCITCGKECGVGLGPKTFCSDACRPLCGVSECTRTAVGRADYCSVHQSSIYKRGRLPEYSWAQEKKCLVCGAQDWEHKGRKVCSPKCQQILHRGAGVAPERYKQCPHCTVMIDMFEVGAGGRKKRADTMTCATCKRQRSTRHPLSVLELAERDGVSCGICSEDVDMKLVFPDLFRASVDHVIPTARGGANDPENLQLSHLWCNLVKQDRVDFTI